MLTDSEVSLLEGVGWRREELVAKSDTQLMGVLGCTLSRVKELRSATGRRCHKPKRGIAELRERYVASGFGELDQALGGGFRVGTLTELVGRAGCGKTQLCLQASSRAKTLFLDTENSFHSKRLVQIGGGDECLEKVYVWRPRSVDELSTALAKDGEIERMAESTRADLLIVDSVAALVRTEFSHVADRQRWLAAFAISLKRIAAVADLAVLATNHVVADFQTEDGVAPALGLLWHHAVTTRLFLDHHPRHATKTTNDRDDRPFEKRSKKGGVRRQCITVSKSPCLPSTLSVPYSIETRGLVFSPDNDL